MYRTFDGQMLKTYHISVLWICWRAFVYASAFSRDGNSSACEPVDAKCFFENLFRWKLCLIADTCVLCVSAILRNTSTHCWRLAAFAARIFNVSPDAQVIVNVRESSSLGFIMAPAKCSCVMYERNRIISNSNLENILNHFIKIDSFAIYSLYFLNGFNSGVKMVFRR